LNDTAPRLLFIPVSGAFGMGEYARSLAIAKGVEWRWPGAAIHFVLSREAPYAVQTPYATTLLDSSPTFHSSAVADLIERWSPDVVIFDNAGRTAQLRAAARAGARVVYISARRRQRRKAFRLRWMRLIDEHWIAYPKFIAGDLGFLERLKLEVMRRPAIRYLDVILDARRGLAGDSILQRLGLAGEDFVLVVPGGGTGHPGARDAVDEFLAAARALAAGEAGRAVATIFVGRAGSAARGGPAAPAAGSLQMVGLLPQAALAELMRSARLVIANGGSTLLQSIACGKPCIAVPIAADQRARIRHCVSAGVAVAAPLDSAAMTKIAGALLADESQMEALGGRAIALGLGDGIEVALHALTSLIRRT
jgi:glycosyltransferase involved in cell wall biosynthesis